MEINLQGQLGFSEIKCLRPNEELVPNSVWYWILEINFSDRDELVLLVLVMLNRVKKRVQVSSENIV